MSLPVGERWKLRAIARAAARADPNLAARFRIFNRLSRYEYMPRTERLTAGAIRRKNRAERAVPGYLMSRPEALLTCQSGRQRRRGTGGHLVAEHEVADRAPVLRPCSHR
jgi:hypothetical protein